MRRGIEGISVEMKSLTLKGIIIVTITQLFYY